MTKFTFILSVIIATFLLLFNSKTEKTFAILGSELLVQPWILKADKSSQERYQLVDPNVLIAKTTLRLTYDLHGTCLLGGDASALIFDQPFALAWHFISLSNYGRNCYNGIQIVDIPLKNFSGLDLSQPVGTFHIRIWHQQPYFIDITSAVVFNPQTDVISQTSSFGDLLANFSSASKPKSNKANAPTPKNNSRPNKPTITPTLVLPSLTPQIILTVPPSPSPTLIPTLIPTTIPISTTKASWSIQSVSSMKETKDRICNQRSDAFISSWVNMAFELGVNYVAIENPYENPVCGNSIAYGSKWIEAIRQKGIKVWHRHMPLSFEGIYNVPKSRETNYLDLIFNFITQNPHYFREGDIFTPIPEPQNGGIFGVTYCAFSICQFTGSSGFNQFLRQAIDISELAFNQIGLSGKIKIGYYGFDGFVAWGDNNPDWNGILEDATVLKMGNITIDHYPEIVGDTMQNDLNELEARYPNIPIIIGEWGTITGGDREYQVNSSMQAARRSSVVGFNYWHFGPDGNEALINEQFTKNAQFDEVQKFYTGI